MTIKGVKDIKLLLDEVCGTDMLDALHKTTILKSDPCLNRVDYVMRQLDNNIIPSVILHGKRVPIKAIVCINGKPASVAKNPRENTWVLYDGSKNIYQTNDWLQFDVGLDGDIEEDLAMAISDGIVSAEAKIMYKFD